MPHHSQTTTGGDSLQAAAAELPVVGTAAAMQHELAADLNVDIPEG